MATDVASGRGCDLKLRAALELAGVSADGERIAYVGYTGSRLRRSTRAEPQSQEVSSRRPLKVKFLLVTSRRHERWGRNPCCSQRGDSSHGGGVALSGRT